MPTHRHTPQRGSHGLGSLSVSGFSSLRLLPLPPPLPPRPPGTPVVPENGAVQVRL